MPSVAFSHWQDGGSAGSGFIHTSLVSVLVPLLRPYLILPYLAIRGPHSTLQGLQHLPGARAFCRLCPLVCVIGLKITSFFSCHWPQSRSISDCACMMGAKSCLLVWPFNIFTMELGIFIRRLHPGDLQLRDYQVDIPQRIIIHSLTQEHMPSKYVLGVSENRVRFVIPTVPKTVF